ncbi:hypothetical protein [Bradyrhizobium genosp. A]|uniref:hypothetical protein n=1 Tax=Bradyrhizobium genosp. A TaxID=83626 RepID=UPI003CE7A66C
MRDHAEATKPSRRAVVATLAAAPRTRIRFRVDAVPPRSLAWRPDWYRPHQLPPPARHPDARLLALGERFQHLCALGDAALETYERCCEEARTVARPGALRHRLEDHVFGLNLPFHEADHKAGFSVDPNLSAFYTSEEIRLLRYAPPPLDLELIPAQKARIDEIEQAWKGWLDASWDADEVAGVNAAYEAMDHVVDMKRSLGKEIAAIQAKTPAGLRVRALAVAEVVDDTGEDDCSHDLMVAAIVRDLLAMTAT